MNIYGNDGGALPSKQDGTARAANIPSVCTLLHIEDDEQTREIVQALLGVTRPQWRLIGAGSGEVGLEYARQMTPDVILLDWRLPDLRGDAILAELRRDCRTERIPVIVLSADVRVPVDDRFLALGAADYVAKPFDFDDLLARLDRGLRLAREGR